MLPCLVIGLGAPLCDHSTPQCIVDLAGYSSMSIALPSKSRRQETDDHIDAFRRVLPSESADGLQEQCT